jgi:hypothetical protein
MPDLLNVTAITLTDFSGGRAQAALARPGIRRAQVKSLLSGSFDFNVRRTFPLPRGSDYKGQECRRNLIPGDSVRLGQFQPTRVPDKTTDHLVSELVGASLVRVIATGEYMFPAQALGTELEKRGLNVLIHSTTRSPLRLDGDIVSITEVPDVYEEPVRNYIYNLPENLSEGEIRLLVHEVPTSRTVDEICRRLHARSVRL